MADEDQFSLCWNNFNANLSAGFHESLCKGDLVDVTLAAEGQLVKAHRLVLSVCSPYFRKMFTTMPANQHAFVVLKDVSHTALKDLITFMYCGEVNVKHDALPTFISTAEALQIKGLTDSTEPPQSPTKVALSSLPVGTVVTHPSKRPHRSSATAKVTSPTVVAVAAPESEDSADEKFVVPPKRTATKQVIGAPTSKRLKTVVHQTISEPQTTTKVQMINPKTEEVVLHVPITKPEPEPEYAEEETTTIEIAEADPQEEEEEATYVEDEQYTDLKYDETYFTENDETKPGITTYATTTEQSQSEAQGTDPQGLKRKINQRQVIVASKTGPTKKPKDIPTKPLKKSSPDKSDTYVGARRGRPKKKLDESPTKLDDSSLIDTIEDTSQLSMKSSPKKEKSGATKEISIKTDDTKELSSKDMPEVEEITASNEYPSSNVKEEYSTIPIKESPSKNEDQDKSTETVLISPEKSTPEIEDEQSKPKKQKKQPVKMDESLLKTKHYPMELIPVKYGGMKINVMNYHFVHHFTKRPFTKWRCCNYNVTNCTASVASADNKVYIIDNEHNHSEVEDPSKTSYINIEKKD